MKKEFVRNPYNYDSDQVSEETGLKCLDESLTQQQFVEESDINYITDKFMRTGQISEVIDMPTGGDFQGIFDYQEAMNLITRAKQEFMLIPAKIRSRFDHDPAKLIDFLKHEENREEAMALGLLQRPIIEPKPKEQGSDPKPPPSGAPEASKT